MERKVHAGSVFHRRLYFGAGGGSHLCILFANGIPAMKEIGFMEFLTGERWKPTNEIFGILPMIMGSIYVTAGAIILGVPIGILTSVFMAKYCPKKIYPVLKGATELWQESRPLLYGFFGLVRTCAIDQRHLPEISLGWKWKQHSDCIYLTWNDDSSTIIGVTESAIRSVPAHYYEGALALGATHERSIFSVVLPAAKSGVVAGIVLGIGRAIGETMAVIMVAGNQARMLRGL